MTDQLTVAGTIATEPRFLRTSEGLAICSFRLAAPQRRFDQGQDRWRDGPTHWYTVSAYRELAEHAHRSLRQGEPVLVAGTLRLRGWQREGRSGTHVELEARSLGHDLRWGESEYRRAGELPPRAERGRLDFESCANNDSSEPSSPSASPSG